MTIYCTLSFTDFILYLLFIVKKRLQRYTCFVKSIFTVRTNMIFM